MTTVVTRGAASAQALGYASSSAAVNYVEDVFSTYLYTGNNGTQTINNGIDLAGEGGLFWGKQRSSTARHWLIDTARGDKILSSNLTGGELATGFGSGFFTSSGVSFNASNAIYNASGDTYASWTFRKQPKFFDIVTYTGDGTSARAINHNLGSAPGMIVVKCTNDVSNWPVYHRSLGATQFVLLNKTDNAFSNSSYWANTEPTSTQFSVGFTNNQNSTGQTYVAYLFAHDAGGFGLTGTDNVISCGSYVGNGSATLGPLVDLGYEPQWVMVKRASSGTGPWSIFDTMRGLTVDGEAIWLNANDSGSESASRRMNIVSSTGFRPWNAWADYNESGVTYIYIAIRRGPMKVPTDATKVFAPIARTGTGAVAQVTGVGSAPDLIVTGARSTTNYSATTSRLAGPGTAMFMPFTQAENTGAYADTVTSFNMNGVSLGSDGGGVCNGNLITYINWFFCRAPGFFDVVCYTAAGSTTTQTHNLASVPELMIFKKRNGAGSWYVWSTYAPLDGAPFFSPLLGRLESSNAFDRSPQLAGYPSSTTFTVGSLASDSGFTYVAYLFATLAGVSKVGSYTGTGTTLQINCGFTGGARFVLIKRTDDVGDWYVWDSARGIVAGNDPYLLLNSTAAEVTGTDYVDTYSAGFEISSTAPAAINANGGTFIFLAIA